MSTNTKGIYYSTSADAPITEEARSLALANSVPVGTNYIINGGMDIWQRGTSFSYTSPTITYTADRWSITNAGGSGTPGFTISRQSGLGTPYSLRFQRNSSNTATTFGYLAYSFESLDSVIAAGKQVTLSFYARSGANYSPTSSILNFRLVTGTGTDQSLNNTGFTGQVNNDSTAILSTSWQRYSLTVSAPSNTTQLGVQLWSQFTGTAGAADYYEITGVQVELGAYATLFRRNATSIQAELAACQRYFIRMYDPPLRGVVGSPGNNVNRIGMVLPVKMRTAPSTSFSGTLLVWDGSNSSSISSIGSLYTETTSVEYDCSMANSSYTTGRAASLYKGGGGYFDWYAEL